MYHSEVSPINKGNKMVCKAKEMNRIFFLHTNYSMLKFIPIFKKRMCVCEAISSHTLINTLFKYVFTSTKQLSLVCKNITFKNFLI